MPRGKNYVNNNKGMALQAGSRKKMVDCMYGAGCTRPGCIYKHPPRNASVKKSREPCMSFLAGQCAFPNGGCQKRHPPPEEADRLRAKYSRIKCRHGESCRTKGCLYQHPGEEPKEEPVMYVVPNVMQQQAPMTSAGMQQQDAYGMSSQHDQMSVQQQQLLYYRQLQIQKQALMYQQAQQRRQQMQQMSVPSGPDSNEFPPLKDSSES